MHAVAVRLAAPAAKARYQAIEAATGVPWFVVAVIHEREAGGRWDRPLGWGDPLAHVSIHVPRGRGPFLDHPGDGPGHDAFYRGAVDALTNCARALTSGAMPYRCSPRMATGLKSAIPLLPIRSWKPISAIAPSVIAGSSGYLTSVVVTIKNALDISVQFYFAAFHPDRFVAPFSANCAAVGCKDQDSGFFHERLDPLLCLR
jgi:hypothetical protein